jgi:acetoin utilization protein AcuB
MLVRDRMSRMPITTKPSATVPDALQVMRGSKVRQLPVVDEKGSLVGIVALDDLLRVSPSPATSLSVWELDYLLEKITVQKVMTTDVITISEDTAIEEAGRIMADNKVSGLPVLRGDELVGIVTESHLFHVLLELFGAREPGIRVTARVQREQGGLARLSAAVAALGATFVAFGIAITFKVQDVGREELIKAIEPFVDGIEDVRD